MCLNKIINQFPSSGPELQVWDPMNWSQAVKCNTVCDNKKVTYYRLHLDLQYGFEIVYLFFTPFLNFFKKEKELTVYSGIWDDLTPDDLCQELLKSKQGRKTETVCCTKMVTLCWAS